MGKKEGSKGRGFFSVKKGVGFFPLRCNNRVSLPRNGLDLAVWAGNGV